MFFSHFVNNRYYKKMCRIFDLPDGFLVRVYSVDHQGAEIMLFCFHDENCSPPQWRQSRSTSHVIVVYTQTSTNTQNTLHINIPLLTS